jgi:endonuclease YncB( thermonuclease family)
MTSIIQNIKDGFKKRFGGLSKNKDQPILTKNDIIEWNDTIPFVPPVHGGMVIKVYDGDTITVASKIPIPNCPLYRFSVRLNGIDCPEKRTKNVSEKETAMLAQKRVADLILHKRVVLQDVQLEKYGRLLARVYVDDICINDLLVKERLALAYDGGTKKIPADWMKYYKTGVME